VGEFQNLGLDGHREAKKANAPARSVRWASFRVDELDCPDEVLLIRQVLEVHAGVVQLEVDVFHHRLNVRYHPQELSGEELVEMLARAGMTAHPWEEDYRPPAPGAWHQHGRSWMTLASAGFLLLGVVFHLLANLGDGLLGFLTQDPATASIVLLCMSMAAGLVHLVPRALAALRCLRPDMNLLMIIAVAGAVAINQWFEAATVTFLFSLSLWIEQRTMLRARTAIEGMVQQTPRIARCLEGENGQVKEILVQRVRPGQRVEVWPGERVPLDGIIVQGKTHLDQSPITGESLPLARGEGDEIFAGTLNVESSIQLEVTRPSNESILARTIRLVEQAQARRAPIERWVDGFARRYTPLVMALSLAVMLFPPMLFTGQSWDVWFYNGLVVLVISCPCSLVISTPVAIVAGLTSAVRRGILIKGGEYLEAVASLRAFAFDKTGTLTCGTPVVQQLFAAEGGDESELLEVAASLESTNRHPLAEAVVRHARERGVEFEPAVQARTLHGRGVEGIVDGQPCWIGKADWAAQRASLPAGVERTLEMMQQQGLTVMVVGLDDRVLGVLGVADEVRPEAEEVIDQLHQAGVCHLVMLTGDTAPVAEAIANEVGLDGFAAGLLPEEKAKEVEQLVSRYGTVAMVGDGVNDSPAMASATIGVSMAAIGSDVAIETSDIALMSDNLLLLPWLVGHARRTLRIVRQNTITSILIKVACLAVTLAGFGYLWLAIVADVGATLLVTSNSLRLFTRG
jgi:Cd2+/Zn2+-exporting ATPase